MHNLRRLLLRLVHAFRPERAEGDLAREVSAHLTLIEDELVRRGMSRDEAYTEARRALGGVEAAKDAHRDARSLPWIDDLLTDVKYATRRLRSRPTTTVLAVSMLAVAIGLSTAMFTIVDALIIRPLPFPHAERLTGLYMGTDTGGSTFVSAAVFHAWKDNPGFDRVEGLAPGAAVVETSSGPVSYQQAAVTAGLFDLLGMRPIRGRLFDASAHEPEAVILSEALWRTAFDADEAIVGREIRVDGRTNVVVGIAPASFRFPEWNTRLWRALDPVALRGGRTQVVARIAADVPTADAFTLATGLAHSADASTATMYARQDELVFSSETYYRDAVPLLSGAVALVVAALCANVSSLLLTRLRARRRELGVCAALGASRARLARQSTVEAMVTGTLAAISGVALAWMLVSSAASLLPEAFLRATLNPLDLDVRAAAVAIAAAFVATFAAAMIPVWLTTRPTAESMVALRQRSGTDSRSGRVVLRGLLIGEVAMACALLVGAVLLSRAFLNVSAIDRGFDPTGMARIWFSFDDTGITDPQGRRLAAADIRDAMLALPGATDAAWSVNQGIRFGWKPEDLPGSPPADLRVQTTAVDPDYFGLYGLTLVRGLLFSENDGSGVVVIGEVFANALWPGADPIGQTFQWYDAPVRVVGVVREPRQSLVNARAEFADIFVPFDGYTSYPNLSLRCDPTCPSEGVYRQRTDELGLAGLVDVTYLDAELARGLEQPRASAALVLTFAIVALVAAAGGVFSVLSQAVQERRREFGIRSALGATPRTIAGVVYREGAIVGVTGLALGAMLSVAIASVLASLSYEASASAPANVLIVVATLAGAIVLALWCPARTAARTDPALLLKED